MALGNFYLTDAGNALLARAQTGAALTITRAQIGEGTWPAGTSYSNITALVKPVKYLSIVSKTESSGQAKITVQFTNSDVGRAFNWTEFGLWAADPEYPEDRNHDILYGTAYAADAPIPIESVLTEFIFNVLIKTERATSVTVVVDSSLVYVTYEMLEKALNIDCGVWDIDLVEEHDITAAAHTNLLVDGNNTASFDGSETLNEHMLNPQAHQNLIVDGNAGQ